MKIAIVTPVFPPYRSGMSKVAELDARQLTALGFDVHVFSPKTAAYNPQSAISYIIHNLQTLARCGNAALCPIVYRVMREFPVVVLHYPFFGGAEFAALAKRRKSAKLILAYHMDVVGSGLRKTYFGLHRRVLLPKILRAADRILATSMDYAERSSSAAVFASRRDRIAELAPSVDVEKFSPGEKSPALLERYGFGAGDKIVLMVGGLDAAHYFKGVPVLLQALASKPLASVKALIVGEGGLKPSYERMARDTGVEGRVIFAGSVSDADLPAHYRLADVFAFPSVDKSEAFGIAALEAAACGVPVVASDLPGVRTVARHGFNGYLCFPDSASALSARLSDLISDEKKKRNFGAAGREMAVREYADEIRMGRWKKIISSVIS